MRVLHDLEHHLCAGAPELALPLDHVDDGDSVLRVAKRSNRDSAPNRTERHLHGIGENIGAAQHAISSVAGGLNVLGGDTR